MAYGRKRYGKATKRYAGRVAKRVARKAFKGALRMPKVKLAKVYATKCGQTTFRAVKKLSKRAKRYGKKRYSKRY